MIINVDQITRLSVCSYFIEVICLNGSREVIARYDSEQTAQKALLMVSDRFSNSDDNVIAMPYNEEVMETFRGDNNG